MPKAPSRGKYKSPLEELISPSKIPIDLSNHLITEHREEVSSHETEPAEVKGSKSTCVKISDTGIIKHKRFYV